MIYFYPFKRQHQQNKQQHVMETDNLYDKSIYPNDLPSILILIFYLPIGVCLLIIRLIIILILLLTNNLNSSSILL